MSILVLTLLSTSGVTMVRVIHTVVPQFGSGRNYFIGKNHPF